MRAERSGTWMRGLFAAAAAGGLLSLCAAACSDPELSDEPVDGSDAAAPESDSGVDATTRTGGDANVGPTKPKVDASFDSTTEAAVDSGRDAPIADGSRDGLAEVGEAAALTDGGFAPTGAACPRANATESRLCGRCGRETRLCGRNADGGLEWLVWGRCQGEHPTGCYPGQTKNEYCGMCGVRTLVCDDTCSFTGGGFCSRPATAECEGDAGDGGRPKTEYAPLLSCDAGGRRRSCQSDCSWSDWSECIVPNVGDGGIYVNSLAVSSDGGDVVTGVFDFDPSIKAKRVSTSISSPVACPVSSLGTETPYVYVELVNAAPNAVRVSAWHSTPPGGAAIDTVMAVYPGPLPPDDTDDDARKACLSGSYTNDDCSGASCSASWAGLVADDDDGDMSFTIPANSTVFVYTARYFGSTAVEPFQLNVRTEP
jgi:hypothetical protein